MWPEDDMKNSRKQSGGRSKVLGVIILIALGGVVPVKDAWARSPKVKDEPILKVGVYNYARIGGLELREAEEHAAHLFAMAGVRVTWLDCASSPEEVAMYPQCASRDVILRILSPSMSNRFDSHAEALGVAIAVPEPEHAWVASVFNGRVTGLAFSWTLDPSVVLGEAAAHELGHLLLGPEHARKGIMRANWTQQDLEQASEGKLHFDAAQAARLTATVGKLRAGVAPLFLAGSQ